MANEIVEHKQTLAEIQTISQIFRKSGMFPTIKSEAEAVVKVMAGQELGFAPVYSMMKINMFNGHISLSADAMATLIKRSGDHTYFVREHTAKTCRLEFKQKIGDKWETLGQSEYTIDQARTAGLANKDNWKNHPKNMLFARAISNGARWYCPHLISGAYTPDETEEIEGYVNEAGQKEINITEDVVVEEADLTDTFEARCMKIIDMISEDRKMKDIFTNVFAMNGKCSIRDLRDAKVDGGILDEIEDALGVQE